MVVLGSPPPAVVTNAIWAPAPELLLGLTTTPGVADRLPPVSLNVQPITSPSADTIHSALISESSSCIFVNVRVGASHGV